MDLLKQIHVLSYVLNKEGIFITYVLNRQKYYYVVPQDDIAEVLAKIGNVVGDGLSQHDAIMLIASHENEKRGNNVQRILDETDLSNFTKNFFKLPI